MTQENQNTLRILRRKQVESRTGLSRSTIYARIAEGSFPRPIDLGGGRAVGWVEAAMLGYKLELSVVENRLKWRWSMQTHKSYDDEMIIKRFVICAPETAHAATLWITMTWFIEVISIAPLAVITAPEKRCGKSQLLFLLGHLVNRPLSASNITTAALFRSIDAWLLSVTPSQTHRYCPQM